MSEQSGTELSRRQKAAALMMAVGSDHAAELMTFLNETEVEALAKEIAAMREVPVGALRQVVEDLHAQIEGRSGMLEGGIDYARELLARWRGPGEEVAERIVPLADAPFRFLSDVDPEELVQIVAEEHPQTLALVLFHLPASYAAKVLEGLDATLQAQVRPRVATMERV